MKKYVIILLSLILIGFGFSVYADNTKINTLKKYEASIDYSCETDSECTVKNKGNCCGYYPACTNVNATVSTGLVNKLCGENGLAGICGFPVIESCVCQNSRCVAKQPTIEIIQ